MPPRLDTPWRTLVRAGAQEILVLPYFLTLGIHLQRDLPKLVEKLAPRLRRPVRVAPPLDGHPALGHILRTAPPETVQ